MTTARLIALLATTSAALLVLAGCASGPGGASDAGSSGGGGSAGPLDTTVAADGPVRGTGTVIQLGDAAPQLCLGPVALSAPPQCTGPELIGWDWATVDGEESEGGATYGQYAVTGTWDGVRLTVTDSVLLALFDPIYVPDALVDPANAGDSSDAALAKIQTELTDTKPFPILESHAENGYLFVSVVYDDGAIQSWVDDRYLPDTVVIRSALATVHY